MVRSAAPHAPTRFLATALTLAPALAIATPASAARSDTPSLERPPALTLDGALTATSDYRFRGLSLSNRHPVLQASFTLRHRSGFYAGAWGSTLDGWGAVGGSHTEVDLSAGWSGTVARNVTLDAGLLHYAYPGATGSDFNLFEPYARAGTKVGPVTALVGASYAWKQDSLGGHANLALSADASLPVAGTPVALTAHVGRSSGGSTMAAGSHYLDWSLGASATFNRLSLGVAYVDTDLAGAPDPAAVIPADVAKAAVVLSLGASF